MIDFGSSGALQEFILPKKLEVSGFVPSVCRPPSSAIDGDLETYWATETGYPSAEFHLDLGTSMLVMVWTSGHAADLME